MKAPEQSGSSSRFFQAPRADTIALLFQQVATVPRYYYTALENRPDTPGRAVKALHGFPEGCAPHPQVEMQPHSTRTSENLQGICKSSVNDSHQALLIHFLHLSKHLLVFFYLSHKASAISVPVSVSLPLVPVIFPADSTAAHTEH